MIENPAWDIIKDIPGNDIDLKYDKVWRPDSYQIKKMMDMSHEERQKWEEEGPNRSNMARKYTWAIPGDLSIQWIVDRLKGRDVVEIGAGTGYWAWMLSQHGVDVNAYDLKPPRQGYNEWHSPREERYEGYTEEERQKHYEDWKKWHDLGESIKEINEAVPFPNYPPYKPLPPKGMRSVLVGEPGEEYFPVKVGGPEVLALPENQTRVLFLCWPPYDTPMASEVLSAYRGDTLIFIGEGWGGCTGDDTFFKMLEDEWEEWEDGPLHQWWGIHDYLTLYVRKDGS